MNSAPLRVWLRGLLVLFCLGATVAVLGKDDAKVYTVPIRVHLVTGAGFTADGAKIDLWITPDEFTQEVLPEVNRIWQPAGVQWQVASIDIAPAVKSRAATLALDEIKAHEKEIGKSLRDLLPAPAGSVRNVIDLYLLPSIGSANGIAYPKDSIAVAAVWRKPGKRDYHRAPLVQTEPPYVSVAKTCAHELGHNLGLKHPDASLKGRLMIAGPGLELTAEEIATARSEAKRFAD